MSRDCEKLMRRRFAVPLFRAKKNPRAFEMAKAELGRLASGKDASNSAGAGGGAPETPPVVVAMVCRDFACQRPAKTAADLRSQLEKAAAADRQRDDAGSSASGIPKLTPQKVPFQKE